MMLRYLVLLAAGLFLVLLIGGRDQGQVRQGLLMAPIHQPLAAPNAVAQAETAPAPDVAMADFVPVATPAPAIPAPVAEAPAPAAPSTGTSIEIDATPLTTVFSLADTPVTGRAEGANAALRWVSANAINVREGPGTDFNAFSRLTRGEAVTVVADAGDGWVRIRIEGDGLEGYVAERLLTAQAP